MLEYDEKRDYIRMDVDCDITYRLADASDIQQGRCTSISGAGVSFIASQAFEAGKAMEVTVLPAKAITPPMTAFIEIVRSTKQPDGSYEIAATIKSIKAE